eukprot:365520-Chlamydomonas_euryale.AAC.26
MLLWCSAVVVLCRYDVMLLWCYAAMVLCRCGVMPLWCYAAMVLCRYGVMPLWCYAVMVLCRYGVTAEVDGIFLASGPDCSGGCRAQRGKGSWPYTRQGVCVSVCDVTTSGQFSLHQPN